jgi:hypothetical protein
MFVLLNTGHWTYSPYIRYEDAHVFENIEADCKIKDDRYMYSYNKEKSP